MEQNGSTFGTTLAYRKKMSYLCSVKDVKALRLLGVKVFIVFPKNLDCVTTL